MSDLRGRAADPKGSWPVEKVLALLRESPSRIADSVAGTKAVQLQRVHASDEWSANEVLAHLRSCADVWGGCIERILAEDEPTIRAINPRTWIESTDYRTRDFRDSLDLFTAQRSDLVKILERLHAKAWTRSATVTGAGKPLTRTVYDYAKWLASHEQAHIRQIHRLVQSAG